jgi:hypothetical protein
MVRRVFLRRTEASILIRNIIRNYLLKYESITTGNIKISRRINQYPMVRHQMRLQFFCHTSSVITLHKFVGIGCFACYKGRDTFNKLPVKIIDTSPSEVSGSSRGIVELGY